MANNCLVTKLKSSVQNANLPKLAEQKITMKRINDGGFFLSFIAPVKVNFSAGVDIKESNDPSSTVLASNVLFYEGTSFSIHAPLNTEIEVSITDKYKVRGYDLSYGGITTHEINFSNFDYITSLYYINAPGNTTLGNINISNLENCTRDDIDLYLNNATDITGSIKGLEHTINSTIINLANASNVIGDISVLSNHNKLRILSLVSTKVSGNLDAVLTAWASAGKNNSCVVGIPANVETSIDRSDRFTWNVYFGTSMQGYNPTEEELAQGWCAR